MSDERLPDELQTLLLAERPLGSSPRGARQRVHAKLTAALFPLPVGLVTTSTKATSASASANATAAGAAKGVLAKAVAAKLVIGASVAWLSVGAVVGTTAVRVHRAASAQQQRAQARAPDLATFLPSVDVSRDSAAEALAPAEGATASHIRSAQAEPSTAAPSSREARAGQSNGPSAEPIHVDAVNVPAPEASPSSPLQRGAEVSHDAPGASSSPPGSSRLERGARSDVTTQSPGLPRVAAGVDQPMRSRDGATHRVGPTALEERGVTDAELALEQLMLEDARRAMARGEPAAALVALSRHAQHFPNGRLVEERLALTVLALAREGRADAAREAAEAYRARFPKGLLLGAVESALAGQ